MSAVIKIEGLSKRYWLNHKSRGGNRQLREEITHWLGAPFRMLRAAGKSRPAAAESSNEEFWALKDVSLDIQQGDVVGIIGGNGAGKSTLLKILSRITEPTEGRVEIVGRIASLLEVGTGFHSELTGRENIFLNGAILGMSRAEIIKKFDEIVAFAEVEKFLDTPVKRYSSGMYVRLAFAVAAHLEPEILLVDEVLAVGDAQFQQKCLGKMRDVSSKDGRTVLFVSHQMGTVRQLCSRAVLLKHGRVAEMGPVNKVIESYLGDRTSTFSANAASLVKDIAIESASTCNARREPTSYFVHDEPISIRLSCRINRWVPKSELRLVVEDMKGRRVFTSDVSLGPPESDERSTLQAMATIPAQFLRPQTYAVSFFLFVPNQFLISEAVDALTFLVQDGGTRYAASEGIDYGCVFAPLEWDLEYPAGVRNSAVV